MEDFPIIEDLTSADAKLERQRQEGESILDYTQRLRTLAVSTLLEREMPTDPKDIQTMNSLLDGMDRQEINKAKLDLERQNGSADADALALITAVVNNLGNRNPYEVEVPVERVIEHDGPVIEGVTLVEGELENRPREMGYTSFMKEYRAKNPKKQD